jgi:hypothetical protein
MRVFGNCRAYALLGAIRLKRSGSVQALDQRQTCSNSVAIFCARCCASLGCWYAKSCSARRNCKCSRPNGVMSRAASIHCACSPREREREAMVRLISGTHARGVRSRATYTQSRAQLAYNASSEQHKTKQHKTKHKATYCFRLATMGLSSAYM